MALLLLLSTSPFDILASPTKMAKSSSSIWENMMEAPRNTPVAMGVLSCAGEGGREGQFTDVLVRLTHKAAKIASGPL